MIALGKMDGDSIAAVGLNVKRVRLCSVWLAGEKQAGNTGD